MGRILFFVLLAIAAYAAWTWLRRSAPRNGPGASGAASTRTETPQAMISCAHCGLHLPQQEALPMGERFYCCEEHRRRGPAA